jgi:DNA-binding MarR family transcriptional regulator
LGIVQQVEIDLIRLFRDLVRLETDLWNRVDARVHREHGLPLAWLEVMQVISTTPDCRVLDVAETLFITVGGASKVVDKVQAGGWCRRLPNPNDGRSSLIELTANGEGLLATANVTFDQALHTYLGAAAPTEELTELSDTLRRLRQHLITADRGR